MQELKNTVLGFMDFVREQGIVGIVVAFMLGGAISKVVTSMVNDLVNPLLGLLLGTVGNLRDAYFMVGSAKVMWGNFVNSLIDFLVIATIVYFGVKKLGLDRLDKKKQ